MNQFLESVSIELVKLGRRRPWLSEVSGVSLSTINNWFAYDRWPQLDHAYKISIAIGQPLPVLMGELPRDSHLPQWARSLIKEMAPYPESYGVCIFNAARAIAPTWESGTPDASRTLELAGKP